MKTYDRESFQLALASSGHILIATINAVSNWSPERDELLAAIAEHEVMHEGKIILRLNIS